ncbi:MAG: hypothetical protein DRG78_13300 [Epsilonproteobacteria bacterium]|nr:MAG: hypothetical protein DRG78_13300 [Campylobacterota bacterium]
MRFIIIFFLWFTTIYAFDAVSYFKESADNKLLCHVGQYSFKMVSQKNAKIEKIHEHKYFKLNDENLFFLENACQTFKVKKEGVIF